MNKASGPRQWFARLTTGMKMLVLLSLGLLPLGVLALWASINATNANLARSELAAQAALATSAQRLTTVLDRTAITMRSAGEALALGADEAGICRLALARLSGLVPEEASFSLYNRGQRRCTTAGPLSEPMGTPAVQGSGVRLTVAPDGSALNMLVYGGDGTLLGLAVLSRAALRRIAAEANVPSGADLMLSAEGGEVPMVDGLAPSRGGRQVEAQGRLLGGAAVLRIRMLAPPITPAQAILMLGPILMWALAAVLVWFIVGRLLLRPLVRMEQQVSAYRPGGAPFDLPAVHSPAAEIDALGRAFDRVTRTVSRHEADLEAAVERQTRLVREVHHRVKNNLQVVASLLNLHARGAHSEDVAAAYASIQRRVDALAVVHRNHYAELEDSRGVALKALVSELASNLRGGAPAVAAGMQIRVDIEPLHVSQDTAVAVAFFVTELVEFAMLCGATHVSIAVDPPEQGSALLSIETDSLAGERECEDEQFVRFDRILTGLARQLRSSLERDLEVGRYSVRIQVLERDGPGQKSIDTRP